MVVALLAALLVAIAAPITRSHAEIDAPSSIGAEVRTEEALSSVLSLQAESISSMLAPSTDGTSPDTLLENSATTALIPQPLLSAVARLTARGVAGTGGASPLDVPLNGSAISFTLHENGLSSRQVTPYRTVRDALAGSGVALGARDIVHPAADTKLPAGMHVFVDYATPVRLLLGDGDERTDTQATTVAGVFEEHGIALERSDLVFPALGTTVRNGMVISLTMIRDVIVNEDIAVPFKTVTRYDATIPLGQKVVAQAGVNGALRRNFQVHQVNGHEMFRKLVGEETLSPTNEIVHLGSKPADAITTPVEGECATQMHVWSTYYTAISAGGVGITATGTTVYKGIIATDPTVIPLGTRMYVPGYGYGIAADTGGGVKGAHIDLGYGANDVYDWGSKYLTICILR